MTLSTYTAAWKEWCAGGDPEGWITDALRFTFTEGDTINLANKLPLQPEMTLKHETGEDVIYTFCGFNVSMPQKTLTTEYKLDVSMRPVANQLLSRIVNLNSAQLNQIVQVQYRIYPLPARPDSPAALPAGKYSVQGITTARGGITVSCIPPNLSKKRAGVAYRLEEFAGLARF